MPKVKVRIAVAVDKTGYWCSAGWQGATDQDAMSSAIDLVEGGEARYWLEAELDLPTEATVVEDVRVEKCDSE